MTTEGPSLSDAVSALLPVGFRIADATDPDKIVGCLDCPQALSASRAYKEARALGVLGLELGASAGRLRRRSRPPGRG